MIKIERKETPHTQEAMDDLQEACDTGRSYNTEHVNQALQEVFHGKCYICENKEATSYQIEHLIPHRGDKKLKYDWNNLFWVCAHCNNIKSDKYEKIPETINFLMLLVAAISFSLMLLSPELVLLFGSSGYASAAYVIPPVAASVFFIFLYNILSTPQFYYEKTSFLMASSLLAAVVNLGLNYIFIKRYGYVAAGYTTLVCYVLYSIGHAIVSRRVMKEFMPGKTLFDYKCVLGLSIFVILEGIGCNFLFDYRFVRYGLLAAFALVAFVKRDVLITSIVGLKKK